MNNFEQEYKNAMNDVHASDDLRNRIMNMKPQKRTVMPFKTTLVSVAAAVMILVVANDYDFTPNTDGVINETVVSTQMPETEFVAVTTETPKKVEVVKTKTEPVTQSVIEEQGTEESVPMTARHIENDVIKETWEINRYFEYIGSNVYNKISAVISVEYVGDTEFEFATDENGMPVNDTVILNYVTANGGSISVTTSKTPIFESSLDGNVVSQEDGYKGYKVSNDAYYVITASGITHDGMLAIINKF